MARTVLIAGGCVLGNGPLPGIGGAIGGLTGGYGQCVPDKQSSPMREEPAVRPRRRQRRPVRRPRILRRGFDEFEPPEAGPDEEVEIGGPVDDKADGG